MKTLFLVHDYLSAREMYQKSIIKKVEVSCRWRLLHLGKQFGYLDNFLSCNIHKKMQLSSCTFFLSTKKFCYLSEKLGIMGMSGQLCKNDRHAMRRSKKCKSVIPHVINAERAFSSILSHHLRNGHSQGQIIDFKKHPVDFSQN